jgi:signal peptidase I
VFFIALVMKKLRDKYQKLKDSKIYAEALDWVETGWSAVLIAAFIMYLFVQAFKIPSGSMRMTFVEGDHLFVNKFIYGFHIPFSEGKRILPVKSVQRKDVVVFRCPQSALSYIEREDGIEKDFIKRCVALSGDMVEVKNKKLFINGQAVDEPYATFVDEKTYPTTKIFAYSQQYQRSWESGQFANIPPEIVRDNFGPVMVPPGCYFVMGDNRDRSFDSRFWGPLPDNLMKGSPLVLYWPLNRFRIAVK